MKNGKENNVFTSIDQLSMFVCLFFFIFTLVTQIVQILLPYSSH